MSDPEAFRYLRSDPLNEEEVEKWLERSATMKLNEPGGCLCLALEASTPLKMIGYIWLSYLDGETDQGYLSMIVNRAFRRRGYGMEALAGMLALSFQGLNLHRVAVNCDSRNIPARRLFEKAGLRFEGEAQEDQFVKDMWITTAFYALLKTEHEKLVQTIQVRLPA
jgi:RimJ/RimL family protein N-acetyltransferase